jgi:hypothetical protein
MVTVLSTVMLRSQGREDIFVWSVGGKNKEAEGEEVVRSGAIVLWEGGLSLSGEL